MEGAAIEIYIFNGQVRCLFGLQVQCWLRQSVVSQAGMLAPPEV